MEIESCQTQSWVKQFEGHKRHKRFAYASAWISLNLLFSLDLKLRVTLVYPCNKLTNLLLFCTGCPKKALSEFSCIGWATKFICYFWLSWASITAFVVLCLFAFFGCFGPYLVISVFFIFLVILVNFCYFGYFGWDWRKVRESGNSNLANQHFSMISGERLLNLF